jgi:transposase InsO family protein
VAYNRGDLPVLPACHFLSRLYLEEAHRMDHAGVDAMVMRSRSQVWITRVRLKAKAVKKACFTCKRTAKRLGEQKMAPLPEHRMGPAPPFLSTAVDLFGPLPISGAVNKRSTGKAWGVIFVCTSRSLVHVEIAERYSTESFLMAVRRFMALHGAPKRFQSDQGTPLVAASKQLATWDWTAVHEQAERMGAEWHIVPTGGQHYNGQAERLIGLLKGCLEGALNNRRLTLGELSTVVAEAA